jgi:hypothetical protein
MDRHDLPDATAADIAVAHMHDLEVQGRFGVRFVTYRIASLRSVRRRRSAVGPRVSVGRVSA